MQLPLTRGARATDPQCLAKPPATSHKSEGVVECLRESCVLTSANAIEPRRVIVEQSPLVGACEAFRHPLEVIEHHLEGHTQPIHRKVVGERAALDTEESDGC